MMDGELECEICVRSVTSCLSDRRDIRNVTWLCRAEERA